MLIHHLIGLSPFETTGGRGRLKIEEQHIYEHGFLSAHEGLGAAEGSGGGQASPPVPSRPTQRVSRRAGKVMVETM